MQLFPHAPALRFKYVNAGDSGGLMICNEEGESLIDAQVSKNARERKRRFVDGTDRGTYKTSEENQKHIYGPCFDLLWVQDGNMVLFFLFAFTF